MPMPITTAAQRYLAASIIADAKSSGTYFVGPHSGKVYLSTIPGIDLRDPECTAMLDELRKVALLSFSRCDLVAAADPELVKASEWMVSLPGGFGAVELHFLVVA